MAVINTWHTARKGYRCGSGSAINECDQDIAPGDRYVRSAQTPNDEYGGPEWSTMRLCLHCAQYYKLADPKVVAS